MTKAEQNELNQLQQKALNRYLDKADIDYAIWLDDDDALRFCELYNEQWDVEDQECVCGQLRCSIPTNR